MSNLLKRIIIGEPSSGKSTYLKRSANRRYFNWRDYKSDTLSQTQERIRGEIQERLGEETLPMDEPFFINPPIQDQELFDGLCEGDYIVATHRIAYFLLSKPREIILVEKQRPRNISISELSSLVIKPSQRFYEDDLKRFAQFIRQFKDVDISTETLTLLKKDRIMQELRTTFLVRDALLAISKGNSLESYLKRVREFFSIRIEKVEKEFADVIRKQLSPIEI